MTATRVVAAKEPPEAFSQGGRCLTIGWCDVDTRVQTLALGASMKDGSGDGETIFVAAARFPGPDRPIRYFALTTADLDALAAKATTAATTGGHIVGRFLGPAVRRWKADLRQAFLSVDQIAELAGTDESTVREWMRSEPTFPLAAFERAHGPLFVREEVGVWLEGGRP